MDSISKSSYVVTEIRRLSPFIINSDDDLFRLFSNLIQPMRVFEETIERKKDAEDAIYASKNVISSALVMPLIRAIMYTIFAAIPFLILWYILVNQIRNDEDIKLFIIYVEWAENLRLITGIENWLTGLNEAGFLAAFILTILYFLLVTALIFVFIPIVIVLLPLAFVVGTITTIIDVIKGKATIAKNAPLISYLENDTNEMLDALVLPLSFVPPDYRYSDALRFFFSSYSNSKVATLKEAVHLYDDYLHKQRLEEGQERLLQSQQVLLRDLSEQNKRLIELDRKVSKVKRRW